MSENSFVWEQKYRPRDIESCVLPKHTKALAKQIVKDGQIPNMMFAGSPGTGKTTLAYAIANEIGADVLFINASSESSIDTMRTRIKQFASTVSLEESPKLVILDEADGLTPASQGALRGYIEQFETNAHFIMTVNFQNKLIEALHSRLKYINFNIPKEERAQIAGEIYKRAQGILEAEGIGYDKKVLQQLVKRYFPDFRRLISELQTYSVGGEIDNGILAQSADGKIEEVVKLLKNKEWSEMRTWVAENSDVDFTTLTRALYDQAHNHVESKSLPDLVLLIADAQYRRAFVADPEVHTVAFFTEVMANVSFK